MTVTEKPRPRPSIDVDLHERSSTAESQPRHEPEKDDNDCAVDESRHEDDHLVELQRTKLQHRISNKRQLVHLDNIHRAIPFHWAPTMCPLAEPDIEACVALERFAFSGAGQGASRKQVSSCPPLYPSSTARLIHATRSSTASRSALTSASACSTSATQPMPAPGGFQPCLTPM